MHLLNGKDECADHMLSSELHVELDTVEIQFKLNIFHMLIGHLHFFSFGELPAHVHCPFYPLAL